MDLSVSEAARLLAVSEDTVYRWIRDGSLPACRVRHQHRLNRVELQEWAAARGHHVSPELFAVEGTEKPFSLVGALEQGGIYGDLHALEREGVLQALTELPGIPSEVDRRQLLQFLLARESLACTGVGRGIAVPHPRDPVVLHLPEPRVLLGLLRTPIDFGALDGEPVRALFLLLSPSIRAHLQILAQLAHALHDDLLRQLLLPGTPPEAIIGRFRALEQKGAVP